MSKIAELITPQTKKLYLVSQLAELRPLWKSICECENAFRHYSEKEENGALFESEADLDAYIQVSAQRDELQEKAKQWWHYSVEALHLSEEEFQKQVNALRGGEGKKKKNSSEEGDQIFEKLKSAGALAEGALWGDGKSGGLANAYLNLLADYMCAEEHFKSKDFDAYLITKIEKINDILPRSFEYMSAQAVLLKKIGERAKKNPRIKEESIINHYMGGALQEASTRGADNHLFRCLASGRFYLPENGRQVLYSDFFLKNYGKKFNVNFNLETRKHSVPKSMNLNDIIEQVTATYGKITAQDLQEHIIARGVSKGDFGLLNAYDLSKIVQKPGAALNGATYARKLSDISQGCPQSPYQKFAQRLGKMLEIGKKSGGKTTGDFTIKASSFMFSKNVWEKEFTEAYPKYSDFLKDCGTIYGQLKADFEKNGCGAYFDKWSATMCETGQYTPDKNEKGCPFEINIHHKLPVKLAKKLDHPAEINSDANYLMFIEYKAPIGEKLTKHLQEHAKESASTASVPEIPDERWLVTSGNVTLHHKNYRDPESFAKLRQQSGENGSNTLFTSGKTTQQRA